MEKARVAVENAFGDTQKLWNKNACSIELRSGSMPVAAYFEVAMLLTNCYTCMYMDMMAGRFLGDPFSLEDYLNLGNGERSYVE